jgi:MraZ protein
MQRVMHGAYFTTCVASGGRWGEGDGKPMEWGKRVVMWGDVGYLPNAMQHPPLRGTYECSLDNRFRMAIPAKVRDGFVQGVTMSVWFDGCVMLAPRHEWQAIVDRLFGEMDVMDASQRQLSRLLHAQSYDQDALDGQGRVLVPELIRGLAEIDTKVTVVGARDYLELWNPARFKKFTEASNGEGVSTLGNRIVERAH